MMRQSLLSKSLLMIALAMVAWVAQAKTMTGLSPVNMRGLWFPKNEAGATACAHYLGTQPVEPGAGALVVSENQMVLWNKTGVSATVFVTDVHHRRQGTWRIQGLLDLPPYDTPKVLETYVIELRQDELHWSSRRNDEQLIETVATTVYQRCGY